MSATLSTLMISSGNTLYHTPEFLTFVHTHESFLKANSVSTPLDPGVVHKFEFNFMSLVVELGYPIENLMFLMVVNDINCPTQMTHDFKEIKIPDPGAVDRLKALYRQAPGRI